MRHGDELDVERTEAEPAAERHDVHRDVGRARLAFPLRLQQRRGKLRRVEGNLEPRPQIDQRAEMIFMRMREHEAEKIVALLDEITNIGQDEIDPGQIVAGKRNAEVNRNPFAMAAVAEAVDGEIHADLAGAAERREDKLVAA